MATVTLLSTEVDGNTFTSWTSPTIQIPSGDDKVMVVTVASFDFGSDTIDTISWDPDGGAQEQLNFIIREQEGTSPFVAAQIWYKNIGSLSPTGTVTVTAGPGDLGRATISIQVIDGRDQGLPEAFYSRSNSENIDVTTLSDGAVAIGLFASNGNTGAGVVTAPWQGVSFLNAGGTRIRGVTGYIETPTASLTNFEVTGVGGNSLSALVAASWAPAGGGGIVHSYTGTGGANFGGTAVVSLAKEFHAGGGIAIAGAAAVSKLKTYNASGGLALTGGAGKSFAKSYIGVGGVVYGGQAVVSKSIGHIGAGGMTFGGAAATTFIDAAAPAVDPSRWPDTILHPGRGMRQ